MDKLKRTIENKYVYTFIMSLISYITVLNQMHINIYSFMSFFLFFILYFFFYKIDYKEIKGKKAPFIYAFIFSSILIIGDILYPNMTNKNLELLKEICKIKNIVYLLGYGNLLYAFFTLIIPILLKINGREPKKEKNKIFLYSFLTIFILHLPYFLAYFPANMTSDTLSEFEIFIGGFVKMTDHHPVLHYLFMSIPYSIGKFLFHNTIIATSFVTLTQMIIMALIFAYTIYFLYQKGYKRKLCIILTLIYGLLPVFGFYSTILWKDILFSGLFLLFVIELVKLSEDLENYKVKEKIRYILISLLMLLMRNNAIYMYILLFLVSIVVFRKQLKNIVTIFFIVIGSYFLIKGPIFTMCKIEKPSSKEYIAIPLQQIGRLAYKEVTFTKKEKEILNKLIDVEILRKKYNPQTVDAIKFDKAYHGENLDTNTKEFLKLYLNLIKKHPIAMVEGYLTSTLGFYYPNVYYEPVAIQIDKNKWDIKRKSLLPKSIVNKIDKLKSFDIQILSITWSVALWVWTLFFFLYIAYSRGKIQGLYPYLSVVALYVTIMIATPLYIELRYVYGIYTSLPFLIVYTLGLNKEKVRSKKNEK